MKLKTKDLLTLAELTPKEFVGLIDDSIKLKKEFKKNGNKPILKNKTLTMIFQKPSTRTRVTFLCFRHLVYLSESVYPWTIWCTWRGASISAGKEQSASP